MTISKLLERARQFEQEQQTRISRADRPLFHLTPPVGWMNDPNGFCRYRGQYHLFYQYHPYSRVWGPMHWGHAVSDDLLRWSYLPCALAPDTEADAGGCFSGSALPLPDGRLMLAYTGVRETGGGETVQAQCVAVGDGVDFEKSPQNPVIDASCLPEGYSAADFRDPKIWLDPDGVLRMAAANRHADRQGSILLFESENGTDWRFTAELDSTCGQYGQMWECPDFFRLDGCQVLLASAQEMRGDGEFHPGHGTMAILGEYDPVQACFRRESIQPLDWGLDFYAPQTVLTPDGRRVMIAWMDNWQYAKRTPRIHPWYAQMTLPRELTVENGRLKQRPVREIETLWRDTIRYENIALREQTELPGIRGRTLDMEMAVRPESAASRFALLLAKDENHEILIRYDPGPGELILDRNRGGSCQDIAHMRRVRAGLVDGTLTLRALLDKESLELFINGGEKVMTAQLFAPPAADGIAFSASGPCTLSVTAHPLGPSV